MDRRKGTQRRVKENGRQSKRKLTKREKKLRHRAIQTCQHSRGSVISPQFRQGHKKVMRRTNSTGRVRVREEDV